MNILDENIPASQRALLRGKHIAVRQIGEDLGRKGMKDYELIPLLHQLDRPTFFTLDADFYDRDLRHAGYCLVHLGVEEDLAAEYVGRLLRQREFKTKARRMGCVIRVSPTGLALWRIRQQQEAHLAWQSKGK
jgi:hypothetical protein